MTAHDIYSWENWKDYFIDIGLREEVINEYIPYIERCFKNRIPPIFEHAHLAQLVGIEHSSFLRMVHSPSSFYRSFNIPKRSGGTRSICAPYPSLMVAQSWIKEQILDARKVSICATGFRKNKSILDNANLHRGRAELIKIDIKDFFPSIGFRRVMAVFVDIGYPKEIAFYLSKLCTLEDKLPQGASTSPSISNIVCRRMDARFYILCKKYKLRYTRYADDIVISGNHIPRGIARLFFEIIEDEGFLVNQEKVRFLREKDKKVVTGLDISSGKIRITRSFRREIKRDIYFVWSGGLSAHVSRRKIFNPNYIAHLQGRVNFWRYIEPGNPQLLIVERRMKEILKRHKYQ